MKPLLSPSEMAAADAAAVSDGTPVEVLMDRAGRAVAREVLRVAGRRYGLRVALVCGTSNNGGDGFAAARVLQHEGASTRCLVVGDLDRIAGAAATHLARLRAAGGDVRRLDDSLGDADVVVDALFGTGFRGTAEGDAATAIRAMNDAPPPVVAADIPSGVAGESGRAEGPAVHARSTVAIAAAKIGSAVGDGATLAGEVRVADIGITIHPSNTFMAEASDARGVLPRRRLSAHKRSGGAVALLAGSRDMTGAAILAASGALRMGAGYVTLGSSPHAIAAVQAVLPEVLAQAVTEDPSLGPRALDEFAAVLERADALAIGPGLGRGDAQRALVERALAEVEVPVVLDADALNVLAKQTGALEERSAATIITPHPAELARLQEVEVDDVQADRLAAARRAAEQLGCVVLLKGHRTIVARPDGRAVVNPTGGPELATAGTGDVLTGVVTALLAARVEPFEAAWAAAFVHGSAGELAATRFGTTGVLAGDVAVSLPEAVRILVSEA